ncbi:MAG: ferredoxin [Spirochaetia bacterium]|jgi:electron transport complex protein RnfB
MGAPGDMTRRQFLRLGAGIAAGLGLGGLAGALSLRSSIDGTVWQIDPDVCVQCGNCQTQCVQSPSAVKAVHAYDVCGYCDLCSGYLQQGAKKLDTSAESRLCPTSALRRRFIEDPYFEYTIDESLCTGCGKCVKGCAAFGNGSLFLQIRHDRCMHCNSCSIARNCPSRAVKRVSARHPYLLKGKARDA